MIYKIRAVKELDHEAEDIINELHEATFGNTAALPIWEDTVWWLAWRQNEPVAFSGLAKSIYPESGYFYRVGVLPEHRGHGLQRRLTKVFEPIAKRLGYKRIVTDTTGVYSANNLAQSGYRMFVPEVPWAFKESMYFEKYL